MKKTLLAAVALSGLISAAHASAWTTTDNDKSFVSSGAYVTSGTTRHSSAT
jgi:opacity protein-like surface antigen